jgi:drug/metabolite transporter (DMT)-like permease
MYQTSFASLLIGCLASAPIAFSHESFSFLPLASWPHIFTLIGLGVFGSGIAYIMYYALIQKGSPEFASMVTYLVPATAIMWGYTLLDEEIHWSLLGGLACILLGVFLAGRQPKAAEHAQPLIKKSSSAP